MPPTDSTVVENGGPARNRTGVHGFAVRCVTTPPPGPGARHREGAELSDRLPRRNALLRPQFIMYYLTFTWPEVRPLLERHGLAVEGHTGVCPHPYERAAIVIGTKTR